MARNSACKHCRASKVRCIVKRPDASCTRCSSRSVPCSYVHRAASLKPEKISPSWRGDRTASSISQAPPSAYRLSHDTPILDIARGRPEDILRETEFTRSLILLYFSHFSDFHFMFDEELFLRQYLVGEMPEVILYSVMALSIRFSHAPFRDDLEQAHRGEALYDHARKLLMQDFDRPSISNIQAYVLLSTYKLTYGGSMQAYIFLGIATNMLRVLRLFDEDSEVDPLQAELNRRLICTMALMDRLLAVPLRLPPHFSEADAIPQTLCAEEFTALKRRTAASTEGFHINIDCEILKLSLMLSSVCHAYQYDTSKADVEELAEEYDQYTASMDLSLRRTSDNLAKHLQAGTLRKFAFMHLLYHHVGQLLYFQALKGPTDPGLKLSSRVQKCHEHAFSIVQIIEYTRDEGGFDIHNPYMGQLLTAATVVYSHALLTVSSFEAARQLQVQVAKIRNCMLRLQRHTRLFNWVLQNLDALWGVQQPALPSTERFDRNPNLVRQMLQLGSFYENIEQRSGGRINRIESLASPVYTKLPTPSDETDSSTDFADGDANSWSQWKRPIAIENKFDHFAWTFPDSSLF
ncbi:fungal-specific transcription factor domain-containing protein [Xylariales sp. PMI_506]|nr:fungal-specific transcription factor domain-containing protein [Xylariales sp. PMI_506]